MIGWTATDSKQNRVIVWDEDNRMQSVTDSSAQPTTFKYDDDTNRVVKKGAGGETLYINPWYVAALGRNSKQVFAGPTRIVTKLEQFPSGEGYGTGAKNLTEVYQYFYHPDHLGSTGFATDATGEVYQHLEYFPFGETWVDEVSDDTRVPYRFTGQELDEETKLYYFGARYLDPRTSAWESADPANRLDAKLSPIGLNLYQYGLQNPVRVTDPNGRLEDDPRNPAGPLTRAYLQRDPYLWKSIIASPTLTPRQIQDAALSGRLTNVNLHPGSTFMGTAGEALAAAMGALNPDPTPRLTVQQPFRQGNVDPIIGAIIGNKKPDFLQMVVPLPDGVHWSNAIGRETGGREVRELDMGNKPFVTLFEVTTAGQWKYVVDRGNDVADFARLGAPVGVKAALIIDRGTYYSASPAEQQALVSTVTSAGGYIILIRGLKEGALDVTNRVQQDLQAVGGK